MATATMPPEISAALEAIAAATDDRVSIEIEYARLNDGTFGTLYDVIIGRAGYRLRRYWGDTLDEAVAAAMDAEKATEQQP
jgi:hypothetical protein